MSLPLTDESISRAADRGITILGVGLSLLLLYYAQSQYAIRVRHSNYVLGLSIAIYYLVLFQNHYQKKVEGSLDVDDKPEHLSYKYPGFVKPVFSRLEQVWMKGRPIWYLIMFTLAIVTMVYIDQNLIRLRDQALIAGFRQMDYVIGAIVIFLCTAVTTRAFGKIMGFIVPLGILFALAGPYLPGVFYHSGMSLRQVIEISTIRMGGVYGFILQIGATWVAIFLLLAGFAKSYNILDYLINVSTELRKLSRSGIVHVAVFASMAFGSITGASSANTATTGSFTIPMMKDQGVDGAYAGAIESVASLGGQLIPPIMGIAAFIMADLLGIPYLRVVQAGLLPAFLFYLSLVVSVELLVLKLGWTTQNQPISKLNWGILTDFVWYVIPFGTLVYLLAVLQYSPLKSGYYTILATIGIMVIKTMYEEGASGGPHMMRMTINGLRQGAVDMVALIAILGSIGVLIGVLTQTGFAQKLSTTMVSISGGSLIVLLIMAMAVSIIFGMGIPAPAAYVLVASLVATSIVQFGIQAIGAHLFVYYFAMYSSLTPPVGPATAIAADLADADYLETAFKGMKLATPGFLVPYIFLTNSSLIYWEFPLTLLALISSTMSIIAVCISIFAYDGRNELTVIERAVYAALAAVGLFGTHFGFATAELQVGVGFIIALLILFRQSRLDYFLGYLKMNLRKD